MFFWWWCFLVHGAYSILILFPIFSWNDPWWKVWISLCSSFFIYFLFSPNKWTVVCPSCPSAMCESLRICRSHVILGVSGPWRQSKKSDETAKVYPKSTPRHTKTYGNISWSSTAQTWKLTLSRGCVVNTCGRSHRTPPKAVPTCEGTAFRHRLTTSIYSRCDFSRHMIIYAHQRCVI